LKLAHRRLRSANKNSVQIFVLDQLLVDAPCATSKIKLSHEGVYKSVGSPAFAIIASYLAGD
ncbi:hypothetical protein MNBD_NITROSPINAE02-970, partial [hydrothermal vent metagenome]